MVKHALISSRTCQFNPKFMVGCSIAIAGCNESSQIPTHPREEKKEMKHRNYKIFPKNQCQPMRLAVMHASRHHWSSITTHFYLSETLVICSLSHEFPKYPWHPYSRRCISKAPFVRKRENQQTQPAQGPRGNKNIPRYVQSNQWNQMWPGLKHGAWNCKSIKERNFLRHRSANVSLTNVLYAFKPSSMFPLQKSHSPQVLSSCLLSY